MRRGESSPAAPAAQPSTPPPQTTTPYRPRTSQATPKCAPPPRAYPQGTRYSTAARTSKRAGAESQAVRSLRHSPSGPDAGRHPAPRSAAPSRHKKSTTYGPRGTCRRNLYRRRTRALVPHSTRHSARSASVHTFRRQVPHGRKTPRLSLIKRFYRLIIELEGPHVTPPPSYPLSREARGHRVRAERATSGPAATPSGTPLSREGEGWG